MVSRGFTVFLALLRLSAGLALIGPGLHKTAWFLHPTLDQQFATWAQHPANDFVAKYLHAVGPHHAILARLVVLGELGLGALLVLGLLTPLAALLAFFMVLNFHFAGGQIFTRDYFLMPGGLSFLLVFPVLMLGRAGTALGMDGLLSRRSAKAGARPGA